MRLFKYWRERIFNDIGYHFNEFLTLLTINFVALDSFSNMTENITQS
jgi:hypothetical protein